MTGAYAVDLDQLAETVDFLAGADARLGSLLDDLRSRVAALHLTWIGLSASSHADAHCAWEAGFADMREALADMREAARTAHGNYGEAVRTNTSLWEQVR